MMGTTGEHDGDYRGTWNMMGTTVDGDYRGT